ncbi:MAG: hypothetical protein PVH37_29800 [Desulfobacterales bacterium]
MKKFLVLIALACLVLLIWGGPKAYSARSYQNAWDLGHLLLFAALTLLVLKSSKTIANWSFIKQLAIILAAVLLASFVIELAQRGMAFRNPDIFDILRNFIGSLFTFAFFSLSRKCIHPGRLRAFRMAVLFVVALSVIPLAVAVSDEIIASNQFPILSDFESPFEQARWSGEAGYALETGHARRGKKSMKIVLHTTQYSGVALDYFPHDWRNYEYLKFSIFNGSDETLHLVCRIHDNSHYDNGGEYDDRFNKNLYFHQGWNDIAISLKEVEHSPKGRKMDLRRIQAMGIFSVNLLSERIIYLDYVRLE